MDIQPPSAAWWGGWWERLIRSVKDLLKRMLGQRRLTYDQLRTCLSHAERVVNDRPLTAVTEDQGDLKALTPSMFMLGNVPGILPEAGADKIDSLGEDFARRGLLKDELQRRFKKEYLSQLIQRGNEKPSRKLLEGEIVLIGSDDKKRVQWPIGQIIKLIPGVDGMSRVAQIRTAKGILIRPIQRLFALELGNSLELPLSNRRMEETETVATTDPPKDPVETERDMSGVVATTRAGRCSRRPVKFQDYEHG